MRKQIGYLSSYLPPEIIWACGLTPVRLRPGDSLAAADGYLPRNFSIEARALLGAGLEGNLSLDAVVFLDEDDTSRRLFDVWQACVNIPAIGLVPLPRLQTELACQRYAKALEELASRLSSFSSQPLSEQALKAAIEIYNEQRALWRELQQRWMEGYLTSSEWYDLRWQALTLDPELANSELVARLDQITPSISMAGSYSGMRLLVLGGMQVSRRLLSFLEASGAHVVAEDSEAGERTLTQTVFFDDQSVSHRLKGMLEALASAYLAKPPGPRPNALPDRLDRLTRLLDERCVRGVIALYPKFADAYLAEYLLLVEAFKTRSLPTLLLEDDGESGFSGQQRTRLEAFLEVLA